MKTPIEVAQIKAEALREAADDYVSEKTTIYREGDPKWHDSRINNWLRERADALVTPPVELPTEATLGWLTTSDCSAAYDAVPIGVPVLDTWKAARYPGISLDRNGKSCGVSNGMVTAFTPAVAVPKAALDDLRSAPETARRVVLHFLAAVDEANR